MGHELRQHIGHAHVQPQRPSRRPILDGIDQLTPKREDLVGVLKHHLPHVGRHQAAPLPAKELFVEGPLEGPDLRAHRRL